MQDKSTHRVINSRKLTTAEEFPNTSTHPLTKLNNLQTHQLIHSKLKYLFFILQYDSNFHSFLAKIQANKVGKYLPFLTFHAPRLVCF